MRDRPEGDERSAGASPRDGEPVSVAGARFDPGARLVTSPSGIETRLRRQSAEVLAALVAARGRILDRAAIHARVWGHVAVTDDSLTQCVGEIRAALGEARVALATEPGQGYRLAAVEREEPDGGPAVPRLALSVAAADALGPAGARFAAALRDEILLRLAGRQDVEVAAGAPRADGGRVYALDIRADAGSGGPDALATLTDRASGATRWAERFDLPGGLNEAAPEVARAVVATLAGLDGALARAERARRRPRLGAEADFYALFVSLRADDDLVADGPDEAVSALVRAERCVALAPRFARGWLMLAWRRHVLFTHGWGEDDPLRLDREHAAFRRAAELDPGDPLAFAYLALSLAHRGAASEAARAAERGVDLARRRPDGAVDLTLALSAVCGEPERAIRIVDAALDRAPPPWNHGFMLGRAAFFAGDCRRALEASALAADTTPKLVFRLLAAAELGDAGEALANWRTLRTRVPDFDFERYAATLPIAHPRARAAYRAAVGRFRRLVAA